MSPTKKCSPLFHLCNVFTIAFSGCLFATFDYVPALIFHSNVSLLKIPATKAKEFELAILSVAFKSKMTDVPYISNLVHLTSQYRIGSLWSRLNCTTHSMHVFCELCPRTLLLHLQLAGLLKLVATVFSSTYEAGTCSEFHWSCWQATVTQSVVSQIVDKTVNTLREWRQVLK